MTTRRKKTRAVKKHPTRPREDHKKPMAGLAGRAFDDQTIVETGTARLARGSMTQKSVGLFASSVPFWNSFLGRSFA